MSAADDGMSLNESLKHSNLTQDEIAQAEKLVEYALSWRGQGYFGPERRFVLTILTANYRQQQRARGKKSKGYAKNQAARRKVSVYLFLWYIADEKYRKRPTSRATIMEIIRLLDGYGDEASEQQVRRAIYDALKHPPPTH
jgi:hypothetical protein